MEELYSLYYETSGVCTDTRNIEKDCLFICLKGANFNGNTFALNALKSGAKYVIVDEPLTVENERIFLVDDSLKFLQNLANYHRKQFNIPVIGITGSNGKTTTKELVTSVLKKKWNTLATVGNLNNHIGVPLTLLKISKEHEIAVIEMGANKPFDIEELCSIAEPTHGIITNIGKAHLEGFKDFEGVLKTKTELYHSIDKKKGTIVYNADDQVLTSHLPHSVSTCTYGTNMAQIEGVLIDLIPFVEFSWSYESYHSPKLTTHLVGKYNFYNFLAAISFGILFDVPFAAINEAIEGYIPDNNRSQIKKTANNTLILDCYNANPTSMASALESFALINHSNKMLIMGDMRELGEESDEEHQKIIQLIEQLNLKGITVGSVFKKLKSSAILQQFSECEEAIEFLKTHQITSSLVLLKGSRGIGLERLEFVL
jgi:UDP-N-acetylmuramoyl-tripeptide--D-alanyl-D-alanine ligase